MLRSRLPKSNVASPPSLSATRLGELRPSVSERGLLTEKRGRNGSSVVSSRLAAAQSVAVVSGWLGFFYPN